MHIIGYRGIRQLVLAKAALHIHRECVLNRKEDTMGIMMKLSNNDKANVDEYNAISWAEECLKDYGDTVEFVPSDWDPENSNVWDEIQIALQTSGYVLIPTGENNGELESPSYYTKIKKRDTCIAIDTTEDSVKVTQSCLGDALDAMTEYSITLNEAAGDPAHLRVYAEYVEKSKNARKMASRYLSSMR